MTPAVRAGVAVSSVAAIVIAFAIQAPALAMTVVVADLVVVAFARRS